MRLSNQNWVSEDWIREARRKSVDLSELSPENACSRLEEHAPPEPIEVVIQRIEGIGRELFAERELKLGLKGSQEFLESFSESILAAVNGLSSAERVELVSRLVADERYCEAVCQSVSSEAKKQFKKASSHPVRTFLDALSVKEGTIPPVLARLREAVATLDQTNLSSVDTDVHSAKLSNDDVIEHVRAIAETIESEYAERQRELASRLRRDAKVKTAFRRLAQARVGNID